MVFIPAAALAWSLSFPLPRTLANPMETLLQRFMTQGRSEMRCKMLGGVQVPMSGLNLMCVLRKEKNGPSPGHSELDESIFHLFQPSFSSGPKSHLQSPEPFCQVKSLSVRLYVIFFSIMSIHRKHEHS